MFSPALVSTLDKWHLIAVTAKSRRQASPVLCRYTIIMTKIKNESSHPSSPSKFSIITSPLKHELPDLRIPTLPAAHSQLPSLTALTTGCSPPPQLQMHSPSSSSTISSTDDLLSPITDYNGKPFDISINHIAGVTDDELQELSVRQLNQRLQGHDRHVISMLKAKRRVLKNRGYALNCRVRRLQNTLQLESDNLMLRDQLRYMRHVVSDLQQRLAYYEPGAATQAVFVAAAAPGAAATLVSSPYVIPAHPTAQPLQMVATADASEWQHQQSQQQHFITAHQHHYSIDGEQ